MAMNQKLTLKQALAMDCPTWSEARKREPELNAADWIMRGYQTNAPMEIRKPAHAHIRAPKPADAATEAGKREGDHSKDGSKEKYEPSLLQFLGKCFGYDVE